MVNLAQGPNLYWSAKITNSPLIGVIVILICLLCYIIIIFITDLTELADAAYVGDKDEVAEQIKQGVNLDERSGDFGEYDLYSYLTIK